MSSLYEFRRLHECNHNEVKNKGFNMMCIVYVTTECTKSRLIDGGENGVRKRITAKNAWSSRYCGAFKNVVTAFVFVYNVFSSSFYSFSPSIYAFLHALWNTKLQTQGEHISCSFIFVAKRFSFCYINFCLAVSWFELIKKNYGKIALFSHFTILLRFACSTLWTNKIYKHITYFLHMHVFRPILRPIVTWAQLHM